MNQNVMHASPVTSLDQRSVARAALTLSVASDRFAGKAATFDFVAIDEPSGCGVLGEYGDRDIAVKVTVDGVAVIVTANEDYYCIETHDGDYVEDGRHDRGTIIAD